MPNTGYGPLSVQVFGEMSSHAVCPDVVTCCSLVTAFEMGGKWQLSLQVLIQMCEGREHLKHLACALTEVSACLIYFPDLSLKNLTSASSMPIFVAVVHEGQHQRCKKMAWESFKISGNDSKESLNQYTSNGFKVKCNCR